MQTSVISPRIRKTLRLTFSYVGNKVKLEDIQTLNMLAPVGSSFRIEKGQSGFWFEILDAEKTILYQRSLYSPIRFFVEVHGQTINDPSTIHKIDNPKGTFDILSPDFENGNYIVLYSSPFDEENMFKPAYELAEFNLNNFKSK